MNQRLWNGDYKDRYERCQFNMLFLKDFPDFWQAGWAILPKSQVNGVLNALQVAAVVRLGNQAPNQE